MATVTATVTTSTSPETLTEADPEMLSVQSTKVVVLFAMLALTFMFSMIPLLLMSALRKQGDPSKARRYKIAISILSCYAAGVFLATCLLDLFPEVRSQIADGLDSAEILTSFPLAEFVMCFGFFIIMLTEQLVLQYKAGKQEQSGYKRLMPSKSDVSTPDSPPHFSNPRARKPVNDGATRSRDLQSDEQHCINGDTQIYGTDDHEIEVGSDTDADTEALHQKSLEESGFHPDPSSHSPIRSLMLLLALSLHSIFEGLAVGLQPTRDSVLGIFGALGLHKSILAFSLGLNLVQSSLSIKSIIKSNAVFAMTSPVGIAIGIGITDVTRDMTASSLINGVLQGLACGTFLYVTFFEILPHEFNTVHHEPHRMLKFFFVILGYGTVTAVLFLHPEVVRPSCERGAQPMT